MKKSARLLGLIVATGLLPGCGSSPATHYYTLAVVKEAAPAATALRVPVQVAAVHLPPSLDRREMVRQTGANSVDISDQNRWDAPLDGIMRRVMSEELAAYFPNGMIVLPDAPAPPQMAQIVISIARFGPGPDGSVALTGSWALLRGSPATVALTRDLSLESDSRSADASGQAAAMSGLLGKAAAEIATTLAAAL